MIRKEAGNILSIFLLIIILLILIVGGFFWWQQSKTEREESMETREEPETTVEEDPTAGWETYRDRSYQLSFKYPADWPKPKVEDLEADNFIVPIDYRSLDFSEGESENFGIEVVDLSDYRAYRGDSLEKDLDKLKNIYQAREATGAKNLWLPSGHAGQLASTQPEYIETADGEFRGIYYFSAISQGFGPVIDCLIIMTDGQDKVFQLHMAGESDKATLYQGDSDQTTNRYSLYIKTLDPETSTETIVTKFNTIYRYIALSLKSIE
jgi:hypothetical protein